VKLEAIIPLKRVEEPVQWHAESSLIERHKEHHVSFRMCCERRILRHTARLELNRHHKPMLYKFL
jgi:hypothetical protein